MRHAAWFVLGQGIGECRLPQVGRDGVDLVVVQAEIRHLCGGAEVAGLLQPHRNPIGIQLEPDVLEIGANLFHVLQETLGGAVEQHDAQVELAVSDLQSHGAIVHAVGFVVGLGLVGLLHQLACLLEIVFLLLFELLDLLADGEQVFRFLVVALVAMATHTATLAEKIFAFAERPPDIVADEYHVRRVARLAARFHVSTGEERPEPMFIGTVSFLDARGGAAIPLVAGRTSILFGIVNLQEGGFRVARESVGVVVRFLAL